MKKIDLMMNIERWLINRDFKDMEFMYTPSELQSKDIKSYIKTQREWVRYKDKSQLESFDNLWRNSGVRGLKTFRP